MLDLVAEHGIKVKTNPFYGLRELPKAVELAHSGKMQGKPVVLIYLEAIKKEKAAGKTMI
jgi:propanol-preferring alcohol dehydrogenase